MRIYLKMGSSFEFPAMQEHRLAAILFTDIVGSTVVMQKDELTAVSMNRRYEAVLKQSVTAHHGQILNDYGDGSLCCFGSAIQAVRCAVEIQQELQTEPVVPLRIGLHIGEIVIEDGKVFGDGGEYCFQGYNPWVLQTRFFFHPK